MLNLFGRYRCPVGVALVKAAGTEYPPFADIAERHRAQIQVDLIAQLFPKIVGQTSAAIAAAADRRTGATSNRPDRLVDGGDDVGDPRLVAAVRQQITAARAAHAFNQPAAAQLGEELLQIAERDFLPLGNLGERHRAAIAMLRQIDHRHHRIAAFGAEPHGFALATRRRLGSGAGAGATTGAAGLARSASSSLTRARKVATSSSRPVKARATGSETSGSTPYGW